jgi:2-oxo-4-hydroxy-4-carboxy-5-ureidoimidazoline decarboxylase
MGIMPDLDNLNSLSQTDAQAAFLSCCGSRRWAQAMAARRPYASAAELSAAAEQIWRTLAREDWLEAFASHPKIGDRDVLRKQFASNADANREIGVPDRDRDRLGKKFASTASLAAREQAGVTNASEGTLQALAEGNRQYEARFGHIFIVCATGKTADEMLALLERRLHNDLESEIVIAAGEQEKITHLRLQKLYS